MRIFHKTLIAIVATSGLIGILSTLLFYEQPAGRTSSKPKEERNKLSEMIASCQVEWEMSEKEKLHNPSSLDWVRSSAELGLYKKKIPVISVPYRATNALGATVLNQALCKIDSDTGKVLSVIK